MRNAFFICALIILSSWANVFAQDLKVGLVNHPVLNGKRICAVSSKDGITVWATHNQLVVFNPDGKSEVFDAKNSPLVDGATISDVAVSEQKIWVTQINATNGYGIFRYDGRKWDVFKIPEKEGLLNNRHMKIHVDQDSIVWFGNEFEGVVRMIEAVPLKFKDQKIIHLYKNRLLCLYMQLTHLWIGSSDGVVRYRSEVKSNYYLNIDIWKYPEFPARAAFSITGYGNNSVVAGTDLGIAIFNGKNWRMIKKKAGVLALPAMNLQTDGNDLWIGSPIGLQRWNPSRPSKLFTTADGLPGNSINTMVVDENKNLLIGTEKGAAIIVKEQE